MTPGSTFKIITCAAAIDNIPDINERVFTCSGEIEVDGEKITCMASHGQIGFEEGMSQSLSLIHILVMIGRGALGNPWIFQQVNAWLGSQVQLPAPGPAEKMYGMLRHIRLLCDYKGEEHGMREARKHAGWYLKGLKGAAGFRREAGSLTVSYTHLDVYKRQIIHDYQKFIND